jgi:hypothetical protein
MAGWQVLRVLRTKSMREVPPAASVTVMLRDRSMPTSSREGTFGLSSTFACGRQAVNRATSRASSRRAVSRTSRPALAWRCPAYAHTVRAAIPSPARMTIASQRGSGREVEVNGLTEMEFIRGRTSGAEGPTLTG